MKKMKLISMFLGILMLLSACEKYSEAPTESKAFPSGVDHKPYISFTSKSGEKLYVGMSREDCEKALGFEIADGWLSIIAVPTADNPDGTISISSLNGVIQTIGINTSVWDMDNGIRIGTGKEEAVKGLGEPEREDSPDQQRTTLVYALTDTYKIILIVESDGKISSFGASNTGDTSQTSGIRTLMGSGTGNAHFEGPMSPREYLDITHNGLGEFMVTLNSEYVVIDRIGKYQGRIFTPSQNIVSYDVVADGAWAIWSDSYTYAAIFTDETSFKGTGDFATLYLSPDTGGIGGTWKVIHEGAGKFILRMNSFFVKDLNSNVALLEVDGTYTGEIQVENVTIENDSNDNNNIAPMAFEIITEGSWTLERVK